MKKYLKKENYLTINNELDEIKRVIDEKIQNLGIPE